MNVLLAVVLEADVRSYLGLCGTHGKGHREPEPAAGRGHSRARGPPGSSQEDGQGGGPTCAPKRPALLAVRRAGPVVAVALAVLAGDAVLLEHVLRALGAEPAAVLGEVAVVLAGPAEHTCSLHLHGEQGYQRCLDALTSPGTTAQQHPGLGNISQHPVDPDADTLLLSCCTSTETPPGLGPALPVLKNLPSCSPVDVSTLQSWQHSPRAHSAPSLSWHVVALQQRSEHSCETGMG